MMNSKLSLKFLCVLCCLAATSLFANVWAQAPKTVWVFVGGTYDSGTSTQAENSYRITNDAAAFGSDDYRTAIFDLTSVNNQRTFKSGGTFTMPVIRRSIADVTYNYDLTVNPMTSAEDPTLSNILRIDAGFHSQHGWRFNYAASGGILQVKVTGDAIIKLRGSAYNSAVSKVTASVSDAGAGSIVPNDQVTAILGGGNNNFYYAGGANTITFTYSGTSFLTYITIINEGSGKPDLRSIYVGETEIALTDFKNNEFSVRNIGYIANPAEYTFPVIAFAMKSGLTAPVAAGVLNTTTRLYTYTFELNGTTYKVHIPYESEVGYSLNDVEKRYDVTTWFGLRTVANMLNTGTAVYKTVYLFDGVYDLSHVSGAHGVLISAAGVTLLGESHNARIIGLFEGIGGATVALSGNNTIVRNLSIESTVGLRGVAPALAASGNNSYFHNVRIIGGQDTYVGGSNNDAGSRKLFHECIIVGTVDYICTTGGNTVDYFLRCDLQLKEGGVISAPQGQLYFRDCTVSDHPGYRTANNAFSLSRPWRDTGKAYFINTTFNIIPANGFVGMGGGFFPAGSSGTVGNVRASNNTLFNIVNPPQDPAVQPISEANINRFSSIYTMCGATLAAFVTESVTIPAGQYATLCSADALIVPEGVTAYAVESTNDNYAILRETYPAGTTIPAHTPVIVKAEVSVETVFQFGIAASGTASSATNLLSGSLVHRNMTDNSVNYYTLPHNTAALAKQNASPRINANTAYLALSGTSVNSLPFSISISTSTPSIYKDAIKDGVFYDLQGRIVSNPQKGQIYIVDGEKVFYF